MTCEGTEFREKPERVMVIKFLSTTTLFFLEGEGCFGHEETTS